MNDTILIVIAASFYLVFVAWWITQLVRGLLVQKKRVIGVCGFATIVVALLFGVWFPVIHLAYTTAPPKALLHVLLSTLMLSILCITALQALLLAAQEYLLRHKRVAIMTIWLPPLEIMENLLFRMLVIGFVLLTLVFLSSLWSFYPIWISPLWQKALLSLLAWLIFAALLIGRHFLGWRGRHAIFWSLGGVVLTMLIFFSSELL